MHCLLNDFIITEEKEFDHPQAQKKIVSWVIYSQETQ